MTKLRFALFTLAATVFNVNALQSNSDVTVLEQFGNNPGELTAKVVVPQSFKEHGKQQANGLLVVLHGCAQDAESFARQSGIADLAASQQMVMLLPQQSSGNNVQSCFNWFSPKDNQMATGEVESLISMIDTVKTQYKQSQVYLVGLSAGAAMASVLLSHYPEKFVAGALISGVPYPCANGLIQAIACMKNGPSESAQAMANTLAEKSSSASASPTSSQWPELLVISGSKDSVVHPKNSEVAALQWAALHEIKNKKSTQFSDSITLDSWYKGDKLAVQHWQFSELTHGIPVDETQPNQGQVAPFLLQAEKSFVAIASRTWFAK